MVFASGFSWFALLPGIGDKDLLAPFGVTLEHQSHLIASTWLVCAILVLFAAAARIGLNRAMARPGIERFFPESRLTPRNFAELYAGTLLGLMRDILGTDKDARVFFPLVGTLFIYIVSSNVMGLVPGLLPPTDSVSNNVGMAVVVFLVFNAAGILRDPVNYVKHLAGPLWWMAWFILPLEVLGLCIRPVTLTVRLTANMFADHAIFGAISGSVPWWVPVPTVLLVFGLFVSLVQAFVFSLLSTIYIGLALPHHDEDHHDDHHH